jgi:protein phosphatase
MEIKLDIYGASHQGKVRDHNEDAFVIDKENGIFLIADGVGGNNAGEIASRIVSGVLPLMLHKNLSEKNILSEIEIKQIINKTLQEINQQIFSHSKLDPKLNGMASTVVFCLLLNETAYIVNVGDSRAYLIHNGNIFQITKDHSLIAVLLNMGQINKEEAKNHPSRHVITSSLGQEREIDIEINSFEQHINDILILCSDGLTDMIEDEKIYELAIQNSNSEITCSHLISAALENGGKDNVTVIVAKWSH